MSRSFGQDGRHQEWIGSRNVVAFDQGGEMESGRSADARLCSLHHGAGRVIRLRRWHPRGSLPHDRRPRGSCSPPVPMSIMSIPQPWRIPTRTVRRMSTPKRQRRPRIRTAKMPAMDAKSGGHGKTSDGNCCGLMCVTALPAGSPRRKPARSSPGRRRFLGPRRCCRAARRSPRQAAEFPAVALS